MPNQNWVYVFISEARVTEKKSGYIFPQLFFGSWEGPSCKPISQHGGKCCIPDQNQKKGVSFHNQFHFIQAFPLLLHINRLRVDRVNERPSAWSTSFGTCRYSATQPGATPLRYLLEAPSLLKNRVKFQSDTLSQGNAREFSGKPHGNL